MSQWEIEMELRKEAKALDKAHIEIPYPKRIIINGKDEYNA